MLSDINVLHLDVGQASNITANTAICVSRCWTPKKIVDASHFHEDKNQCNFM